MMMMTPLPDVDYVFSLVIQQERELAPSKYLSLWIQLPLFLFYRLIPILLKATTRPRTRTTKAEHPLRSQIGYALIVAVTTVFFVYFI